MARRRKLDPCLRNARKGEKIFSSIIGTGAKMAMGSNGKSSNSGCMLIFIVILAISIFISACSKDTSNKPAKEKAKSESTTRPVDTLQMALNKADSIINSGELVHLETFEIGKIKNIFINVEKVTTKNDMFSHINIKKDCGNDYYYSWENKIILKEEIKYYIDALNEMQKNIERTVTHEERYSYNTKSGLTTLLYNENNNKGWKFALKFREGNNGTEYLNNNNIDDLKLLLDKCILKINEIQK